MEPVADDEALMRLLQQGCDDALDQLVRRWEGPMLGFFYRSVGDLETAEDLRQDLFVRLYVYRATFRGDSSFRVWLYQLATNLARTYRRRAKTRRRAVEVDPNGQLGPPEVPDNSPAASEIVQRHESVRLVRKLLDALSAEDREALILRFFEGLRYREISQALAVAEPTAKSRVYRAVERLRRMVVERGLTASEFL